MEDNIPPFFIGGCPRSGTTLLRSILTSHPEICVPRELDFLRYIENFENVIHGQDTFYDFYIEQYRFKYLFNDENIPPNWDNNLNKDSYLDVFNWLKSSFLKKESKTIFGDKTPGNEIFISSIRELFPKSKFIYVLRDPRAVAHSLNKVPWSSKNTLNHILVWRKSVNAILKHIPSPNIHIVKYEDLVINPESETERICEFLGIEFYNAMLINRGGYSPQIDKNSWTDKYEQSVGRKISAEALKSWEINERKHANALIEILLARKMKRFDYEKQFTWMSVNVPILLKDMINIAKNKSKNIFK